MTAVIYAVPLWRHLARSSMLRANQPRAVDLTGAKGSKSSNSNRKCLEVGHSCFLAKHQDTQLGLGKFPANVPQKTLCNDIGLSVSFTRAPTWCNARDKQKREQVSRKLNRRFQLDTHLLWYAPSHNKHSQLPFYRDHSTNPRRRWTLRIKDRSSVEREWQFGQSLQAR